MNLSKLFSPWYARQPRRLLREIEAMEASRFNLQLVPILPLMAWGWVGTIPFAGGMRLLAIRYPWNFPENPPTVHELEPSMRGVIDDRGTLHQLSDGGMCLFAMGHGRSSWSPDFTVVEVLERYLLFREKAQAGQHIAEFYSDDEPVSARAAPVPRYLDPILTRWMISTGSYGICAWATGKDARMAVLKWARDQEGKRAKVADLNVWSACELAGEQQGVWCRLPNVKNWRQELRSPRALLLHLKNQLPKRQVDAVRRGNPILLLRGTGDSPEDVVLVNIGETQSGDLQKELVRIEVATVSTLENALFQRVDGALDGRTRMKDITVVMVGLGSLGSFTALSLARAGVSRFLLFDPDVLRVENVCRHVGDLSDVGRTKVEIVADLIRRRNPGAEVVPVPSSPLPDLSINAAHSSHILAVALANPSTIVVTTVADDRVERPINRLLVESGITGIFGSVLGKGEFGRIFRVIPGVTACYQCILHCQTSQPEAYPALEAPAGVQPGVGDYHQPGIPGIGIDVEQVALLTARFTLQTIGRLIEGGVGYPDERRHHLLWSNREGWVFDRPLQLVTSDFQRVEGCHVCGARSDFVPLTWAEQHRIQTAVSNATRPILPPSGAS